MTRPVQEPPVAERDVDLVVLGGAGHVGLPLSLAFAAAGMRVGIYDIDKTALERIGRGEMPFREKGADQLLTDVLATGRLELSSDPSTIARSDQLMIVVGTPVDEYLAPSMTIFEDTVAQVTPHLRDGSLLVLRSTVYPGTTAYVAETLERHGRRADIAYCPERILEGKALEELRLLPQIVGADSEDAARRASALFEALGARIIQTTSVEAELAKLFTNTWRYMKFAIANQFFMIADQAGADYDRVLRAVREDYPRGRDLPGPGFAAGPCLFKDTLQLAAFSRDQFQMGQAAVRVNENMPAYIVSALERRHGSLRGKTIGILGMAFKGDSDDPRASLSFRLRKLLAWAGARVLCTDPYVADDRLVPIEDVLAESEILVLGAPHSVYRELSLDGREIVDLWGAVAGAIKL